MGVAYVWSHGVLVCLTRANTMAIDRGRLKYADLPFILRGNSYYWLRSDIMKFSGRYYNSIRYSSLFARTNKEMSHTQNFIQTVECNMRFIRVYHRKRILEKFPHQIPHAYRFSQCHGMGIIF